MLRNFRKVAETTRLYTHIHKRNSSINIIKSKSFNRRVSILNLAHNQNYWLSNTTRPSQTAMILNRDIIPSNINLSEKELQHSDKIFTHLIKTGQMNLITFISELLYKPTRQSLSKPTIAFLIQNEQIIKRFKDKSDNVYLRLSFIESTPQQSIKAAINEIELLFDTPANKTKNDILNGIYESATSMKSINANNMYHGWLKISSKITKARQSASPASVRSFTNRLNTNPKTITIAVFDKSLEKEMKTFKNIVIYALCLDAKNGGFHETTRWLSQIDIKSNIFEETPQLLSTKVIAKSTKMDPISIQSETSDNEIDRDIKHRTEAIQGKEYEGNLPNLQQTDMKLSEKESDLHFEKQLLKQEQYQFIQQKYQLVQLQKSLIVKESELMEQEKQLRMQQQEMNEEANIMVEKRKEINILHNNTDAKQKVLCSQEKELQQKFDILKSNEIELDKRNKDHMVNCTELDSQKKELQTESERLKSDQMKLEGVNVDLQLAQQKHQKEDEKLEMWKKELQNEQQRLDALQHMLQETIIQMQNVEHETEYKHKTTKDEVKILVKGTYLLIRDTLTSWMQWRK